MLISVQPPPRGIQTRWRVFRVRETYLLAAPAEKSAIEGTVAVATPQRHRRTFSPPPEGTFRRIKSGEILENGSEDWLEHKLETSGLDLDQNPVSCPSSMNVAPFTASAESLDNACSDAERTSSLRRGLANRLQLAERRSAGAEPRSRTQFE
ncbi:unnamed protein product [Lota lota]